MPSSPLWLCTRPRILAYPNFLSTSECGRIIQLAKTKGMEEYSPVTDSPQSIRTSSSCWLAYNNRNEQDYACQTAQDERMLKDIGQRISIVSCLPEEHGETFQVLRYKPGQYYKPHPDFFIPNRQKTEMALGGQRIATMLIYLNDVLLLPNIKHGSGGGGETHFPKAGGLNSAPIRNNGNNMKRRRKMTGLSIAPQTGLGILFFNVNTDNKIEPFSIHESLPVQPGAEKWILTRWIRQRPYPRPHTTTL